MFLCCIFRASGLTVVDMTPAPHSSISFSFCMGLVSDFVAVCACVQCNRHFCILFDSGLIQVVGHIASCFVSSHLVRLCSFEVWRCVTILIISSEDLGIRLARIPAPCDFDSVRSLSGCLWTRHRVVTYFILTHRLFVCMQLMVCYPVQATCARNCRIRFVMC